MVTYRTDIESIHQDICFIEKRLADSNEDPTWRPHWERRLAEAQRQLSEACALRASFYRR